MFYYGERGWYCRKCVTFADVPLPEDSSRIVDSEYQLRFSLTERQKEVSERLREYVGEGHSVLLEAVCGAGKTEIIFAMISDQLARGHKVCFAIARRQVVLEIAERLSQAFSHLKVIAVCQGHTDDLIGDLVVCTTHQLYRYRDYFQVLIIDEPDAFPYKGNDTLQGIARHSCLGATVYLTATPDNELKERAETGELKYLYLSKRPHGYPLCVPEVAYGGSGFLALKAFFWLRRMHRNKKKVILFVGSKKTGSQIYRVMKSFLPVCYVNSETENRDELITQFRSGRYEVCIATSVLERGITISDVQVLVWKGDSDVFDEAALTQIAGRVGRSVQAPEGECLFLCCRRKESVDDCVTSIIRANND